MTQSSSSSTDSTTRPQPSATASPVRRLLPPEGEEGKFSETWFPVCLSADVRPGQVIGRDFLDGRVVIYRTDDGKAHVQSAYCPHLGTDLSCGELIDDRLRCPFHHWQFDSTGTCVRTGVQDPAPKAARLYDFPVHERWGIVFAFNGTNPPWEPPGFCYPDEELSIVLRVFPMIGCDPWVICANTPDIQHIRALHNVEVQDPSEIVFTDHSMSYDFHGRHPSGASLDWKVGIHGTNIFFQQGETGGTWAGVVAPMGLPRPGQCEIYMVVATRITDRSPEGLAAARAQTEALMALESQIVFEDMPILQKIRYRQGCLTRSDAALAKFLDHVRRFPRSHPSSEFIR